MSLALSTVIGAQDTSQKPKSIPPRVFFHSRGESTNRPFIETWKEGDTTFFFDAKSNKSYSLAYNAITETSTHPPALVTDWKGALKFRRGAWWFLQFERGNRPENQLSSLFRYDLVSKSWNLSHQFDVRVSNFEVLDANRILLLGLFEPAKRGYFLGGVVSGDSSTISFLNEAPIQKRFPELIWKSCVTSIDGRMAYVYFPLSGHIYGYDLDSHSLREFRVPWSLLSDESIGNEIETAEMAGKKDCFISAVGHPGASNCYFLPLPGGQMAFIYKVLDEEEEKRTAFSDGTRPEIEKVGSIMLIPDDPNLVVELTPPSQKALEQWCWSSTGNRLVPMKQLKKIPEKKAAPKKSLKIP